jgi:hypothetical protein
MTSVPCCRGNRVATAIRRSPTDSREATPLRFCSSGKELTMRQGADLLITAAVFGRGPFYYLTMGAVVAVVILSANTSFADSPRLC